MAESGDAGSGDQCQELRLCSECSGKVMTGFRIGMSPSDFRVATVTLGSREPMGCTGSSGKAGCELSSWGAACCMMRWCAMRDSVTVGL